MRSILLLLLAAFLPTPASARGVVSSRFDPVLEQLRKQNITSSNAQLRGAPNLSTTLVRVNSRAEVQAYIHVASVNDSIVQAIRGAGAKVELTNAKYRIIQAWIPYTALETVAALPGVRKILPPSYGTLNQGSLNTKGDAILKAVDLRTAGLTGKGVKIGVLSDGANSAATAIASGDLPSSLVDNVGGRDCTPGSGFTCNEGTAMLEIIHDLAPDATLGMADTIDSTTTTSLDFVNNVTALKDTFGAQVIVDDIGYFTEPYFEDGLVADAVAASTAQGVIHVSAAGNSAENHYTAAFTGPLSIAIPGHTLNPRNAHNFGGASAMADDPTLNITVGGLSTVTIILQWNDPFDAALSDYDLFLLNSAEDTLLAASFDDQSVTLDPIEALSYSNSSASSVALKVVIDQFAGPAKQLKMFVLRGRIDEYGVIGGDIFGHAAVPGALAVAAVDADSTALNTVRTYSSRGPTEIFFPTASTRQKPDLAGVDNVTVTGAGSFGSPFSGTSAAAPHVGAVAALLLSGLGTSSEVITALKGTATDIETAGFDALSGYGLVNALAAAQSLNDAPDSTIALPEADTTINAGEATTIEGTCSDANSTTAMTTTWTFGAESGVADSTAEDPGAVTFATPGTYTVTFTCKDGLGKSDETPATRTITVNSASPDVVVSTTSGGCTSSSLSSLALLLVAALALGHRRHRLG